MLGAPCRRVERRVDRLDVHWLLAPNEAVALDRTEALALEGWAGRG